MAVPGVTACDLEEVTVPVGDPIVVVHAVMRPDAPARLGGLQFVVVERSLVGDIGDRVNPNTGDVIPFVPDTQTIPFEAGPTIPITGAFVEVANLDYPNDPCGTAVRFTEVVDNGVYWSPLNCPTMRPDDRLALTIQLPDGGVVTGQTRVPGLDSATFSIGTATGTFAPGIRPTINRDRDTMRVTAHAAAGRLLQLEIRRLGDITDFGTKVLVDTAAVAVPGTLINTFEVGDEDDVFRAGRDYIVTVAITDTNYFDFVRSSGSEYTGRGFINRLSGAIGVFGSLASRTMHLRATGEFSEPREGRYRVTGALRDTIVVDATWDVFVARTTDVTEHSTFVEGQWLYGTVNRSADGTFVGNAFEMVVVDTLNFVRADTLRGTWREDGSWSVTVATACADPEEPPSPDFDPCSVEARYWGSLDVTRQ
jgi:hypothetical protein